MKWNVQPLEPVPAPTVEAPAILVGDWGSGTIYRIATAEVASRD